MRTFPQAVCPLLLGSGVLLAGVAGTLCPASFAAAQRQPESQKVSNSQLRYAIGELRATKKELEGADHDYGGHRVEAVEAITHAIHQLQAALKYETGKPAQPHPGKPSRPPSGTEPQAVSDAHLRHAIAVLRATKAQLEAADHDYGGHRADAVEAATRAIHQLEEALKYVKNKE